jgi:uncharacterized membrane protein
MIADGWTAEQIYYQLLGEGLLVADINAAYAASAKSDSASTLQQRAIKIVVTTGAVLVGAGAFSFVASNWGAMSDFMRVAVIVLGMALATGTGWFLREVRGYRATGSALLLLGSIIFGAGIFLCAQIFNVHGNWPDGFVLWMLGTLAMAYALRSIPLYLLGVVAGGVAAAGYPFVFGSDGLDFFLLSSPLLIAAGAAVALVLGLELRRSFLGRSGV